MLHHSILHYVHSSEAALCFGIASLLWVIAAPLGSILSWLDMDVPNGKLNAPRFSAGFDDVENRFSDLYTKLILVEWGPNPAFAGAGLGVCTVLLCKAVRDSIFSIRPLAFDGVADEQNKNGREKNERLDIANKVIEIR